MNVHQSKVHNYLRMTLAYTEDGTIKFSMIDYIDEIISAFDKAEPRGNGIRTSNTPEDLYKVDEDCENIIPEKAKIFHNIVAKTLYTKKWERPDTCTAVAFLTTRVRKTNKYDWGKLINIMNYTRSMIYLPLITRTNVSVLLKW